MCTRGRKGKRGEREGENKRQYFDERWEYWAGAVSYNGWVHDNKNWENGGVEIILMLTSNQQVYHQLEQQSYEATGAYQWQLYSQYPEKCIMSRNIRSQVATQVNKKETTFTYQ